MLIGDDEANALASARQRQLNEQDIARRQDEQAQIDATIRARAEAKTGVEAREAEAARATYYPGHHVPPNTLGQVSAPLAARPGMPAPPPPMRAGLPPTPVRLPSTPPPRQVVSSTTDRGVVRLLLVLAVIVALVGGLLVVVLAH